MDAFNYIIPGILTPADNAATWDYQAQAWLYRRGRGLSAGFNYFADIVGGVISREKFAAMAASDLRAARRAGHELIRVIAHSNGCYIAADALQEFPGVFVSELHLIAAAMPPDCGPNGLNLAADRGQVLQVAGYVSTEDEVLGLGPFLSYGEFGKIGPHGLSAKLEAAYRQVNRKCGHSDWVGRDFEKTMTAIANGGRE